MSCPHIAQLEDLKVPKLSQSVHREECTQCFDNQVSDLGDFAVICISNLPQDLADGIDVCLTCFNGGCLGIERHHARTHSERQKHPFTLNVKRRPKARNSPQRVCATSQAKIRS